MDYNKEFSQHIATLTNAQPQAIEKLLTKPKDAQFGDIALPVFTLADGNPVEFAQNLAKKISLDWVEKINQVGPYVNVFIKKEQFAKQILTQIFEKHHKYGSDVQDKTFVLDYSSPNVAKPLSIGHLRSTIIGGSIKNVLEFLGNKVVGINYIGDWGTQFGKVILAYEMWGDENQLEKDPIAYLLELYVRFHAECEQDEEKINRAREIFSQLEAGDKTYYAQWELFRNLSIENLKRIYKFMNVRFDEYRGEAYYNDKIKDTVALLEKKNLLTKSDGALIIDFEQKGIKLPPVIMLKSNGTSTYALRDVTAAIDRMQSFFADSLLYEVGNEQKLHFQQVFATLQLLGYSWAKKCVHIDHGFYRFAEGKMSTRKGQIILIEDVLLESIERVKKIIQQKNPQLAHSSEFETVAKQVGLGAVYFYDMKHDRIRDIQFDWEKLLDFQGETGPYVQYTYARIQSIIKKFDDAPITCDYSLLQQDEERQIAQKLQEFGATIASVADQYKLHTLCRYLLDLCQLINEYYAKHKIISDDVALTTSRVTLLHACGVVIKTGLGLLCIEAPDQM